MRAISPPGLIAIGAVLVVIGWIIPVLMVLRAIDPSYLLALLSYMISIGGLFVGLIGTAWWVRSRRE